MKLTFESVIIYNKGDKSMKLKKVFGALTILVLMFMLLCSPAFAMTMYAPDGRTCQVPNEEAQAWKNVGWYDYPVTTMYAADGRTSVVPRKDTGAWQRVGWYNTPVIMMYAADGRTSVVPKSEAWAWKNVGWYDYPVVTVYAMDGRTAVIPKADVQAWINVGWYDAIFSIEYAKKAALKVFNQEFNWSWEYKMKMWYETGWMTAGTSAELEDENEHAYLMVVDNFDGAAFISVNKFTGEARYVGCGCDYWPGMIEY